VDPSFLQRLALLSGLLILGACSDPTPPTIHAKEVDQAAPRQVEAEFKDSTVVDFWIEGRLAWKLHTKHLTQELRSQRVHAKPVDLVAYDEKGQVSAHIVSDSGNMDRNLRYFRARGHVVGTNAKGMRLLADSLLYDKDADRISTESHVTVHTETGDVLSGRGFRSDSYLNRWEILSGVTGSLRNLSPLQGLMQ
jgi:LPS export ABC transporter protein LptC